MFWVVCIKIRVNSKNYVPFFSKIPLLGLFFQEKTQSDDKTQLLIFLSANITVIFQYNFYMPSINSDISLKISNLLKTTGKLSEASLNEAKKNLKAMERLHLVFLSI